MGTVTIIHDVTNETVTVLDNEIKDNHIDDVAPNSNKGAQTNPRFGQENCGAKGGCQNFRVLAFYDLSKVIPKSATITAARWYFYITLFAWTQPATQDWVTRRITRLDWEEFESTWNDYKTSTPWTSPGGDYDAGVQQVQPDPTATGWMDVDVKVHVDDARSNHGDVCTFGALITRNDNNQPCFIAIHSKEVADAEPPTGDRAPHLRVTYTLDGTTFQAFLR